MNFFVFYLFIFFIYESESATTSTRLTNEEGYAKLSGDEAHKLALKLVQDKKYKDAAYAYWQAIIKGGKSFDVNEAYTNFMQTFSIRNKVEEGHLFLAKEYFKRRQKDQGLMYAKQALQIKPDLLEAHLLLGEHTEAHDDVTRQEKAKHFLTVLQHDPKNAKAYSGLAHIFWDVSQWKESMEYFEKTYEADNTFIDAYSSAVYLRNYVCKWGKNGTLFYQDMLGLESLIRKEINTTMKNTKSLEQLSVIHPHMTLGYAISSELKLAVAKSHADAERVLIENANVFPTEHNALIPKYRKESQKKGFRLRVGYVSANIKSKTTVYMAQDLWRFHNRTAYEVHVYATTPQDNSRFLQISMRGVDWRKKVQDSVEYFHDCSKMSVFELAELIRSHQIHIMLNWDGYSNNGVRATGLFPMQIAPLQLGHQEYIGTMGASYIQYIVTDKVASPQQQEHIYTEKFIYMPYSFLANSMPHMGPHMKRPQLVLSKQDNPQRNGCGGKPASFVYCNFNKHLKFSPHVFLSWLQTLEAVDGSILCLLENPKDSQEFLQAFTKDYNSKLLSRVRFQPFLPNPYDNQHRNARFCSVVLDTEVYNGHTTAVDALWAGVPVVTRSDGREMSSRVGASILSAIGLTQLITKDLEDYNTVSRKLGLDSEFYRITRNQLVEACLATSPRNPYWDIQRYVRDMEQGFTLIWNNFLEGREPQHVEVKDIGPIVEVQSKKSSKRSSKLSKKKKNSKKRRGVVKKPKAGKPGTSSKKRKTEKRSKKLIKKKISNRKVEL